MARSFALAAMATSTFACSAQALALPRPQALKRLATTPMAVAGPVAAVGPVGNQLLKLRGGKIDTDLHLQLAGKLLPNLQAIFEVRSLRLRNLKRSYSFSMLGSRCDCSWSRRGGGVGFAGATSPSWSRRSLGLYRRGPRAGCKPDGARRSPYRSSQTHIMNTKHCMPPPLHRTG